MSADSSKRGGRRCAAQRMRLKSAAALLIALTTLGQLGGLVDAGCEALPRAVALMLPCTSNKPESVPLRLPDLALLQVTVGHGLVAIKNKVDKNETFACY